MKYIIQLSNLQIHEILNIALNINYSVFIKNNTNRKYVI